MKYKLYIIIFTLIFCFGCFEYSAAQENPLETKHKVYTIYLYNFTKYIQWPGDFKNGEFIIGLLGETEMEDEIRSMAGKKDVNGRKIKVKNYNSVEDIDNLCNILYIPNNNSDQLSNVLNAIGNQPTLIVTNKDGLGKYGSLINFVTQDDKPTFELNLAAFERSGLNMAQQLKTIGIVL